MFLVQLQMNLRTKFCKIMSDILFELRLEKIEFEAFRSFTSFSYSFVPEADKPYSNVTVFIADNGGGKTSILDMIAEQMRVFLNQTFLASENLKDSGLSVSDASLNGGMSYFSGFASWLLSFKINLDSNIEEGESDSSISGDLLLDNRLYLNKISGEISNSISESLNNLDDDVKKCLVFGKDQPVPEKIILPVLAYYGDKFSNNDEFYSRDFEKLNSKLKSVYEGALSPTRFNLKRFTSWYSQKQKEALNNLTHHSLLYIENLIDESRRKASSWENYLSDLNDIAEEIKILRSIRNDNQLRMVNIAILKVLNQGLRFFDEYEIESESYSNIRLEFLSDGQDVLKIDKGESKGLSIKQLSAGEKNVISIVADIAMRLIVANPDEPGRDPLHGQGVVLIDEIDLHLHPSWQRKVLPILIDIFPNIQFVITTHSPFIIQSLKNINIYSLTNNINNSNSLLGWRISDIIHEIMDVPSSNQEYGLGVEFETNYQRFIDLIEEDLMPVNESKKKELDVLYLWLMENINHKDEILSGIIKDKYYIYS
jgi:predicted ATP-binding protein involved in virulence